MTQRPRRFSGGKEITMKLKVNRISTALIAAFLLCLAVTFAMGAQGQRGPAQAPDPLRQLNVALNDAGATALTPDQARQILAMIEDFRASNRPAPPDAAVQQARAAYEKAILNGDLATAKAQIPVLTAEQSANAPARMAGEAALAIGILQVLRANGDQLALLQKNMNGNQLVRMLLSAAGGGNPGQGAGRGGRGPIKK
jgi:arginase family enzyme